MIKQFFKNHKIWLCFVSVVTGIYFLGNGTPFSGFHLADDYLLISYEKEMQDHSILQVVEHYVLQEKATRFRPIYFVHQVSVVALFGDDFTAHHIYRMCLFCCASFLLFWFAKRSYSSTYSRLLFVVLSLVGTQLAVWWRLGPNEAVAVFFLASSLVLTTYQDKAWHAFLFFASVCLMGLSKESFLAIVPALVFLKVSKTEGFEGRKILDKILVASPLFLFVACAIYILSVRNGGGADPFFSFGNIGGLLQGLWKIMLVNWYYFLAILLILVPTLFRLKQTQGVSLFIKKYRIEFIVAALIILPNTLLYINTGMYERYMLPTSIGFALLMVKVYDVEQFYINRWQKVLTCLVLIVPATHGWLHASRYSREGNDNQQLLAYVEQAGISRYSVIADTYKHIEQYYGIQFFLEYYTGKAFLFTEGSVIRNGSLPSQQVLDISKSVWTRMYSEDLKSVADSLPKELIFYKEDQIAPFFRREKLRASDYEIRLQNTQYTVLGKI